MADITNQQVLDAILDKLAEHHGLLLGLGQTVEVIVDNMVTKHDLQEGLDGLEVKLTDRINTVDLKIDTVESRLSAKIDDVDSRLSAKIDSGRATNVKHHLETRKMIGKLNKAMAKL